MKEKIKNAYLLFYERIEHCSEDQFTTGAKKDSPKKDEEGKEDRESTPTNRSNIENFTGDERPQLVRKLTSDSTLDSSAIVKKEKEDDGLEDLKNVPKEFLQNLMEKNQKFHLHKNIFSREYFEFIDEIVTQRQFTPNLKYTENYNIDLATNPEAYYDLETLKFAILFILTAIFRDRSREGIIRFLPFVKKNLRQNVPACMWLLDMFSSKKLKIECLLDCPVSDMQRFTVGLIMVAYRVVYEFEGKGANNKLFDVDSKTQVPKTILANFTNSCINLIFEAKDNNRDFTEFFKIFCEMASCGHEVAEYLISKKVVGRLMDFFYEHVSPHNEFFRDMTDVPYSEPSNYELGQPQEEKKKIRTAWEEFMLRGKNRQTSENHSAQKSYVWKTVFTLLRYCRIGANSKRCKWQIADYDCTLHSNEMTLLTPGPKFIERVINDTHTKIGYRHVAKMYTYLCYEDDKFTNTFSKAIQSGISDVDHPVITSYFRCFATLLTLEDSHASKRRADLCDYLLKTMEENNNFYVDTDVYSNFMLKIAERIDGVRAWFTANRSKWEWLIEWLIENPTPPFGMMQGNVKFSKKRSFMGMSSLKHDLKEYKARSNVKVNKLRNLAQGTLNNNADAWDSDDDLSEHPFKVGDKVDFLPQGYERWVTAEVDTNLEEMIHLQFEVEDGDGEQSLLWVSRDVETLAAHRGMQARQEIVDNEMGNIETGNMPDSAGNQEGQDLFTDGDDSHKGDEGTDNSSEDMNLDIGNH
jgi:ubiquitin carboxyl-terminal hydrolase 9/24